VILVAVGQKRRKENTLLIRATVFQELAEILAGHAYQLGKRKIT